MVKGQILLANFQDELNLQSQLTSDIASWSNQVGYTAYNYYGADTNSTNLYLGAGDHGEAASIVFYVGHGGSNPYRIMNDDGTLTYASDIYDNSQQHGWSKFAFIFSCDQGDGLGSGSMAEAWLHTTSESSDGYHYPDYSMNCFVGWNGLGPWLSLPTTYGVSAAGYWFVHNFYSYAMIHGFSVNAALDQATQLNWQVNFDSDDSPYHTGWFQDGVQYGHLVVFGQGTMYIGAESYVTEYAEMEAGDSGQAQVADPNNLIGSENDGQFTQLLAPVYGDFAWISAQLDKDSSDNDIYLWGYSDSQITHLTVYVSWNYYDWDQVYNGYVEYGDAHSIYCGHYDNEIRWVYIKVKNDEGYPARMYIDAVHVTH